MEADHDPNLVELYDQAPCGLMVTDTNGLILRVNTTFCLWLDYSHSELIQIFKIQDLFSIGSRLFHQTHWAPLLQMQGSVSEIQLEMLSKSKQKIPILLNAIRKSTNGQISHELAFFTSFDRSKYERELLVAKQSAEEALSKKIIAEQSLMDSESQLIALNQQLSLTDKPKDEFLATLAHELRNPLAPMRNVLEVLKLRKLEDPKLEWSRAILDRQVTQLTHLVDDLMEVSRITQGKVQLKLAEVDVAMAIRNAIEASQAAASASKHELNVSFPSKPMVVNADLTRLIQMITNILNNAIKYTPQGGTISIAAEENDGNAIIKVKDTGIGIEANQLKSVFNMFSQVEIALDRSQGGLGIGLSLVKGLADLHNGTVLAVSEGVGMGSEFKIILPLFQPVIPPEEKMNVQPSSSGMNRRVLVIDDNVDITESLLMAFDLLGYEAKSSNDGMEGIELGARFKPDIVLLDIGLPGLNGYEVAKLIRKENWGQSIKLIAATGWGQAQDIQFAMDAGFDSHLTKPIDFSSLHQILKLEP